MDHKKVGTIRLSYIRADGVTVTKDYQAELNNAVFSGNISGVRGTFRGKFSSKAVNVVSNPSIAGRSTAVSVVVEHSGELRPWQNAWIDIAYAVVNVPSEDSSGGRLNIAVQFDHLRNEGTPRFDEQFRPYRERVLINGVEVALIDSAYGELWLSNPLRFYEYAAQVHGPGPAAVAIQVYFPDWGHNVHPVIANRTIRVDYMRR